MPLYMTTIRTNGRSHAITVPPALIRALNWNRGDRVILETTDTDLLAIHGEKRVRKILEDKRNEREFRHGTAKQTN